MGKGVYSIVANDASVGTTIGTFDAINTRNADIRLKEGTSMVVAMSVVATPAAQTTATGMGGRLRFDSTDMGISGEDFATGQTHGGGIASNSGGWGIPVQWIPLDWRAGGGNVVNLSWSSQGIEPADSFAVQAAVHHQAGTVMPPAPWFTASMSGGTLPLQGSRSSNGSNTTTARTSLVSTTIPSRFDELVSVMPMTIQDPAQATTDFDSSFMEITSTIGDFDPQEIPMPGIGAALGTVVGKGVAVFQRSLPMYITKQKQTETVEPFVTGLDTLGAANAYGYSIGLRGDVGVGA